MKYLQNVDAVNATVRTGDVKVSLPPSTTHKTEQVYDNTLSDEDDNNGNLQENVTSYCSSDVGFSWCRYAVRCGLKS